MNVILRTTECGLQRFLTPNIGGDRTRYARGYSHYGLTGGSGLFEGPAKDYQMAQFREITLPLGGILVVTTL